MKKRMISCLLAFTLMLAFMPVWATSEGAVLTITPPEELPRAGDEFQVLAELTGNTGFCAFEFTLTFDKELMECTKIKLEDLMKETLSVNNPAKEDGAIIAGANAEVVKGDGKVATFTFKALQDIEAFDFGIKNLVYQDAALEQNMPLEVVGVSQVAAPEIIRPGGNLPEQPEDKPSDDPSDEPENEPEEDAEPLPTFPDSVDHWGKREIGLAAKNGWFKGDDKGNFNPDADVTRAQFVTVLWRMAGAPEVTEEAPFTDIADQIPEFKTAIAWGYGNGYIKGISETAFDPDGSLTREAGMKILHSYSGDGKGNEQILTAIYDGTFVDSKEISSWAKDSMYWGVYNTLISGTSETTLSPQGTATRAQLAKILVNYNKNFL